MSYKKLGNLRFNNCTLGKAAHEISKMNIIDKKLIDILFNFITLYNKAKHEVNMSEKREHLFESSDAIVCYFCARIIGQDILKKLQYPISQNDYEIYN